MASYTGGLASEWLMSDLMGSLVGGFAQGFVASGGNFEAGLQSAAQAGLFYGAGQAAGMAGFTGQGDFGRAVFHAGAGCISAAASGGDCGRSALAAGVTKYVGANTPFNTGVAGAVKWAVMGGTASSLTGGKFANGAVTGSFQYMYNQLLAPPRGGIVRSAPAAGISNEDKAIARGFLRLWNGIFNEQAQEQTQPNENVDEAKAADQRHSPDRKALGEVIRDVTNGGRKPVSNGEADTILDWAKEVGVKGAADHRNQNHWVGGSHIHVPQSGVNHIPVDTSKP